MSLDELKARSQQALKDQAQLLREWVRRTEVMRRKSEEVQDVRKREASLREVAEQMKASLEDATREQRRLAEEKKRMEEELETLRRAAKNPQRLSLREETGITLASLNMDATTIAKELERRGMSAVDLYARTLQAEDECTRMKLCKERVEE